MAKSLLEKAKSLNKAPQKIDPATTEMEELALAWCRDEVSLSQVAKALGLNNTGYRTYSKLALSLKIYLNKK